MRIGEMLVAEGRLSREQVEKARQVQQHLGGRMGTSLLELGLVDEEVLLDALGRQRATRTVSGAELSRAPGAVVRLIPAKLAKRYGIVPYRLKGRTLFVASRDVGDPLKEDEIGFLTSCLVRSCIALEFRIFEALERHYKISGHPRNIALARRLEARQGGPRAAESDQPEGGEGNGRRPGDGGRGRPPTLPRPASSRAASKPTTPRPPTKSRPKPPRKPQPRFIELDEEDAALLGTASTDSAWPPGQNDPLLLKPTPLPWLAREAAADAAANALEAESASSAPAPAPRPPSVEPLRAGASTGSGQDSGGDAGTASVALSVDEWLRNAASELKHAEIRDDIADVLLAFCEPFLRRRLLLIARRDRIVGWRGEGEGVAEDRVRAIEIPADEPSVFLGLSGSDSFWLGAMPALDANQPLIDGLGGAAPRECVALPVALRSRVVCYLYGDNLDAGVGNVPVAQLRRLAAKAGLAFEVCILKNKMRIV